MKMSLVCLDMHEMLEPCIARLRGTGLREGVVAESSLACFFSCLVPLYLTDGAYRSCNNATKKRNQSGIPLYRNRCQMGAFIDCHLFKFSFAKELWGEQYLVRLWSQFCFVVADACGQLMPEQTLPAHVPKNCGVRALVERGNTARCCARHVHPVEQIHVHILSGMR
jgi:hypothetical protein